MEAVFECARCGYSGAGSEFAKVRSNGRGLCRKCRRQETREQYAKRPRTTEELNRVVFECTRCARRGGLSEFVKARRNGRGLCYECSRSEVRENWAKRPRTAEELDRASVAARAHHERRRVPLEEEKLRRGACIDCSLTVTLETLVVFDFDHRDPTEKPQGQSQMFTHRRSAEELVAEMAKCDLRCANCHRLKTTVKGEWRPGGRSVDVGYRHRKERLLEESLRRGACFGCGLAVVSENLAVFDFSYRDPSEKANDRGMVNQSAASFVVEVAKCDLLCANCNRLRAWREGRHTGRPRRTVPA